MLGRAVVRQTVPPASKTVAAQKGLAPHVFDVEHTRFRQLIELRNRRAELNTSVLVGIRGSLSIARLARIVERMRVCSASGRALHIMCSHCCIPGGPAPRSTCRQDCRSNACPPAIRGWPSCHPYYSGLAPSARVRLSFAERKRPLPYPNAHCPPSRSPSVEP